VLGQVASLRRSVIISAHGCVIAALNCDSPATRYLMTSRVLVSTADVTGLCFHVIFTAVFTPSPVVPPATNELYSTDGDIIHALTLSEKALFLAHSCSDMIG